jgi:hypothetical protein
LNSLNCFGICLKIYFVNHFLDYGKFSFKIINKSKLKFKITI